MRRTAQSLTALWESPDVSLPPSLKRLDNYFIVLENLIVSADDMGIYDAEGKKSTAFYSEAIRKHASKWMHAADQLSQGENDLRNDDIADGLAWESLSLEALDNDSLLKRVLDTIWKIIKAIGSFIKDFFDFTDAKLTLIDHKASALLRVVDKLQGKKPVKSEIDIPSQYLDWFYFEESNSGGSWPVREIVDRTFRVFEVISNEYLRMVESSDGDIINTLKAAYNAEFKDTSKNDDLCRAIEVYKPSKVAEKASASKVDGGYETRALLKNSVLFFKDAPSAKGDGIPKIESALKASVEIKRKGSTPTEGSHTSRVMDLSEIRRLLELIDKGKGTCRDNQHKVKSLQNTQKRLNEASIECAESAKGKPNAQALANVALKIVNSTNKRMVEPIVHLQKLLTDGMDAALNLCALQLKAYQTEKPQE